LSGSTFIDITNAFMIPSSGISFDANEFTGRHVLVAGGTKGAGKAIAGLKELPTVVTTPSPKQH
jgi:hypothetical protein